MELKKEVESLKRKLREVELQSKLAEQEQQDAFVMLATEEFEKTKAQEQVAVLQREVEQLRAKLPQ